MNNLLIFLAIPFLSNIDNSSTKNNNVANTVSEFTMTESEFPKVDGATAMLPMIGEITKSVLNYSDEEAQKYLDENTHGKTAKVYASLINKEKDLIFVSEEKLRIGVMLEGKTKK